jgi:predicted transcriptional regulator
MTIGPVRRQLAAQSDRTFRTTLASLESGLTVRDIATVRMLTCNTRARATSVLARPKFADFDQIPVKDRQRIIGVLERQGLAPEPSARVHDVMRPLDDSMLVAADLPLRRFIQMSLGAPYFLVVARAEIWGLVTRSDLLKLPVRLLAFAFILHLESRLGSVLRAYVGPGSWTAMLNDHRRKGIATRLAKLSLDRLDPDAVEVAFFSDKAAAVSKILNLSSADAAELDAISELRNQVAHPKDFVASPGDLKQFASTLSSVEHWISRLATS